MKQILIIFIVGISLGLSQQAYSSSGALSLEILAKSADLIVVGRVGEVTSVKSKTPHKEGGYLVWSKARVFPERIVKGHEEGPIIIEFAGGRVGKNISVPEDSPKFESEEHVLLFLKRIAGKDTYTVVGMNQGKYKIEGDMVARKNVTVDKFLREIQSVSKSN